MKRTLGVLAVLGTLALAGCSSSNGAAAKTDASGVTKVRMALNNTPDSIPIIVAQKQGYFKEQHLDVTTTTLSDITVVPSLLGKQYDVGFTVAPILIRAVSQGVAAKMIAGNDGDSAEDEGVQMYVGKGITSIKDLEGKRIGSPTLTGNINLATKAWLAKNGVDVSKVQFVQVPTPNMTDQLKADQIDGAELQDPFINTAKADGLTSLGDPERALTDDYLGGTYWAASNAWISSSPKAVSEFRAALKEADDWIAKNPDQAYQEIADYTKVTVDVAKRSPIASFTTDVSAADLKIWGDTMKQYGGFTADIDYDTIVAKG
ncbi:MAG TPA: ABC transporter substrate-binding protein [Gryllotalpicola sp.]